MRIAKDEILIREFEKSGLPLMLKWLTNETVLEYYEGRRDSDFVYYEKRREAQ